MRRSTSKGTSSARSDRPSPGRGAHVLSLACLLTLSRFRTKGAFVSEIFSGDPPHDPEGCIAQGWSVGALLEAWELVGGEQV